VDLTDRTRVLTLDLLVNTLSNKHLVHVFAMTAERAVNDSVHLTNKTLAYNYLL
jgi:hypothetical protein